MSIKQAISFAKEIVTPLQKVDGRWTFSVRSKKMWVVYDYDNFSIARRARGSHIAAHAFKRLGIISDDTIAAPEVVGSYESYIRYMAKYYIIEQVTNS
jgi:hypothetical protein